MKNQKKLMVLVLVALMVSVISAPVVKTVAAYDGDSSRPIAMLFGDGLVLGDDDEKDEEEHKEEDREEDREENKEEHESEDRDDDHDEDEDEDEDDSEDDDDEKDDDGYQSEEQIHNTNGTTTYIKRQEEDGKLEVELKTYDANGRLIEERKLKQEDHDGDEGTELELESYVYNNGDLQELKIKSKEGKEIEISIKESNNFGQPSKVKYEINEQQLKIKITDDRELSITPKNDHFELHDGVLGAKVGLPIVVDPDSGMVFVETAIGLVRVGISPEKALEIIQKNDDFIFDENDMELVEGGAGLEYSILAQKQERLLGLFPILVDAEYSVDAETGEYTGLDQDFWTSVLDLMSF